MAKYSEGSYLIVTFDKYGTKIETRLAEHQGLIGAQKEAEKLIGEEVASYAIMRVLTNSIDQNSGSRWL
jgi:hypothetical protein